MRDHRKLTKEDRRQIIEARGKGTPANALGRRFGVSPRQMQRRMAPEDEAAFHRRFLTPTTIELEFGLHRNSSLAIMKAGGVRRFTLAGVDFGAIWLRKSDVSLIAACLTG